MADKPQPIMELPKESEPLPRTRLVAQFTEREWDIICAWIDGLSNKQIAERLGLAKSTVGNMSNVIHQKLGMTSRTQVVVFVLTGYKPEGTMVDGDDEPD